MKKKLFYILFISFIIRLTFLIINTFFFVLPQGEGDAIGFELHAYELSVSDYDLNFIEYISSGAKFFELLLSFVYLYIGRQPFVLGFIMVILGTYTVYLVYKATLYLWKDYKTAYKAALGMALFPMLAVESALTLREIPIVFFLLLAIISFIKYWKYKKHKENFYFFLYVFLASLFHIGIFSILLGYVVFISFFSVKSNLISKIISISLVSAVLILMNTYQIGTSKVGGSFDKTFETLQKREQLAPRGGSKYPDWLLLSNSNKNLYIIPLRYIAFWFSPLIPWLVRSLNHLIGLIDAFIYLYLFRIILKHRKLCRINETCFALFIMILLSGLIFSLGGTNVGTAIRHRAKFAPILIIIATGMNKKRILYYKKQYFEYIKSLNK